MAFTLEKVDALPQPERGGRPSDPAEVAMVEEIKANPNTWFKIAEYSSSSKAGNIASTISKGRRNAFKGSGIIAKSRKLPTRIEQGTGEEVLRYAVFVQFPS